MKDKFLLLLAFIVFYLGVFSLHLVHFFVNYLFYNQFLFRVESIYNSFFQAVIGFLLILILRKKKKKDVLSNKYKINLDDYKSKRSKYKNK